MIGKTFSHYKIIEKLGEGGMGVVYKAEDTKLKREVALKFLPPEFTRNPEAKKRFLHEAQAASSLQHRNICTIHEIDETSEGQVFISMDFYKGESLKEKISRRPLPLNDVIDIASQLAQGLDKAHEAGITHRDIKPANILITEQNEVKIIDFGLAKLTDRTKVTRSGSTLGTVAYMSPEQLHGKKVDQRTDIWSFGVVLYQMITGILPFKGEYEQALSYAILNKEPEPITALRTGVPLELEWIVMKTLAKDPRRRYQHADELPVDLEALEIGDGVVSRLSTKKRVPSLKSRVIRGKKVIGMLLMGLLLGTILTTVLFSLINTEVEPALDVMRFDISTPLHQREPWLSISPDGKHFIAQGSGWGLYRRHINQLEVHLIEQGRKPFFSPDGRWLCYQWGGRILYKISVEGGEPIPLTKLPNTLRGAFWGLDESIIFAVRENLYRIGIDGSNPHIIAKPHAGKIRSPAPLPGGKAILCTIWRGTLEQAQIGLLDLETDSLEVLIERGASPVYAHSGHIVYANQDGILMVAPFDGINQKVGISVPTNIIVYQRPGAGDSFYSLSNNGRLVYVPSNIAPNTVIEVDREGNEKPLISEPGYYAHPRYSPDGKQLLVQIRDKGKLITWVYDIERGSWFSHIAIDESQRDPEWTPDSKSIIFSTLGIPDFNLYRISADGASKLDTLYTAREYHGFCSVSPDEKWLFLITHTVKTKMDICRLPYGVKSKPQ